MIVLILALLVGGGAGFIAGTLWAIWVGEKIQELKLAEETRKSPPSETLAGDFEKRNET